MSVGGDTALEMRTLADAVAVDNFHFRYQDGLEKGLRVMELASHIDNPMAEMDARFSLGSIFSRLGQLEEAKQQTIHLLEMAERIRDRAWLATAFRRSSQVSSASGDWASAREFSDRALTLTPQDVPALASRIFVEYEVGDFSQGEYYLEQMLEIMRQAMPGPTIEYAYPAMMIPMVARISGMADKLDIARTAAETVFSWPSVSPYITLYSRVGLAWLAVQHGDIAAAEEQYTLLEFHRGTLLPVTVKATDRLLGLLAQTMGNIDQAIAHFEDALAFFGKSGNLPELAWTSCDYADVLRERNGEGDGAKAMSLLDESLDISN